MYKMLSEKYFKFCKQVLGGSAGKFTHILYRLLAYPAVPPSDGFVSRQSGKLRFGVHCGKVNNV